MTVAVADDTHQFCHRFDQLIASLVASHQDVPMKPTAAVKAVVASAPAATADTSAAVKAAAVSAATACSTAAVKVAVATASTAAAVKAAATTAGTAAAVKAVAATAVAAAIKTAAHSSIEAALSPVAAEFGAGEQGEPLVSPATASTAAAVKVATATAGTAAALKAAAVPPAVAARVAAATAGTAAAVKAVATTAAAAAVKAAAHNGTEAALSPMAAEFGAGEQGEPLVSAHTESGISTELPSATVTASQHSEGISTGVKSVSASRSEPEELGQHNPFLHELEAALLELSAAKVQAELKGEQLQLAVDTSAQEPESGKGLSDDMRQHDRWLKVVTPWAEVLEAEGVELRRQGVRALTKPVCREHVPRSTATFTPQEELHLFKLELSYG